MSKPGELTGLTGLRGLASFWVVAYHLRKQLEQQFPDISSGVTWYIARGYLGVDLFFVLSGFVISLSSRDKVGSLAEYKTFLIRRLARIYPVYLVCHLAYALYMGKEWWVGEWPPVGRDVGGVSFVQHLLMVQGWTLSIERSWNLIDWSVSCEWLVYVLFPVFAWVSRSRVGLVVGILWGVGWFYAFDAMRLGPSNMEVGAMRVLYGFGLGVLLERLASKKERRWDILVAGVAISAFLIGRNNRHLEEISWAPLAFSGIVYGLARSGWGAWGWLVWMGHTSYSLYLCHDLVLHIFHDLWPSWPVANLSIAWRLLYQLAQISIILLVSRMLYRYVEVPFRGKMIAWFEGDAKPISRVE